MHPYPIPIGGLGYYALPPSPPPFVYQCDGVSPVALRWLERVDHTGVSDRSDSGGNSVRAQHNNAQIQAQAQPHRQRRPHSIAGLPSRSITLTPTPTYSQIPFSPSAPLHPPRPHRPSTPYPCLPSQNQQNIAPHPPRSNQQSQGRLPSLPSSIAQATPAPEPSRAHSAIVSNAQPRQHGSQPERPVERSSQTTLDHRPRSEPSEPKKTPRPLSESQRPGHPVERASTEPRHSGSASRTGSVAQAFARIEETRSHPNPSRDSRLPDRSSENVQTPDQMPARNIDDYSEVRYPTIDTPSVRESAHRHHRDRSATHEQRSVADTYTSTTRDDRGEGRLAEVLRNSTTAMLNADSSVNVPNTASKTPVPVSGATVARTSTSCARRSELAVAPPPHRERATRHVSRDAAVSSKSAKNAKPHSSRKKAFIDGLEEEMTCPICISIMVGPHQVTPCGHAVCGGCAVQWIETRASAGDRINCPACRAAIDPTNPLTPARTLENMIAKWVENKVATEGQWEGLTEFKERVECWNIHKQYSPDGIISPGLLLRPRTSAQATRPLTSRSSRQAQTNGEPDQRPLRADLVELAGQLSTLLDAINRPRNIPQVEAPGERGQQRESGRSQRARHAGRTDTAGQGEMPGGLGGPEVFEPFLYGFAWDPFPPPYWDGSFTSSGARIPQVSDAFSIFDLHPGSSLRGSGYDPTSNRVTRYIEDVAESLAEAYRNRHRR